MTSLWFMLSLATLQAGAAAMIWREGNVPLALVYLLYGASNVAMIWVHRG